MDRNQPLEDQVAQQARIIDALIRRADRQNDMGLTAYSAFQSTIDLHAQVANKTRDLEIAFNELERLRFDQKRITASLDDALSVMEGGFALFTDGAFVLCNERFRTLLPDLSDKLTPNLHLETYFDLLAQSRHLVSMEKHVTHGSLRDGPQSATVMSMVIETTGDAWFQLRVQRMGTDRVVLLANDISSIVQQNRVEKASLIDAQAVYLQAVFEDMSAGMCTFNADGEVMMFNRRFRELLGLPFGLLHGGRPLRGLLDDLRNNTLITRRQVAQIANWHADMHGAGPFRMRFEPLGDRVLDIQASMLPDGGFLFELTDATLEHRAKTILENRVLERTAELTQANKRLTRQYEEQARVEEELRLAKERAEAAVSSKTRFLAAASHDLLQPINAVKLMLTTLIQSTADTPHAEAVSRIYRAFHSAEDLLHALLDVSRLDGAGADNITPTEVSLSTILGSVAEDQMAVAARAQVDLRVVPTRLCVVTDPVYMMRSVRNLVSNAIEYNRPGGRVLVGCRPRGDKVVLQVWDTGIGIRPEDQARIFEEFNRGQNTDRARGVGLGLSVVERACRHLGHRLWVQSTPGEGSLFCIEMDQTSTRPAAPENISMTQDTAPMDLIALVVENDEDVLFATKSMLEQWGVDVLPVASTAEALRHVEDMGMPPDIILADYQLDDGDTGMETIKGVRALTGQYVPAIIITADRGEHVQTLGQEQGVSVLAKPVQPARLRSLMDWKARSAQDHGAAVP